METAKLYTLAEKNGIVIDRAPLPENLSLSLKLGKKLFVGLDKDISGAVERVCLAHELGHCETMSFYNIYSPLDVRGKHENRADRWAINELIPFMQYQKALCEGYDNVYTLAEYFGVTVDFMQKAINLYTATPA